MREADILVGHNIDGFDLKRLKARFVANGLPPLGKLRTIDTLKIARREFGFTSNKLEFLAQFLGVKQKKSAHKEFPGMELWTECLKDNKRAWRAMAAYNKQDVKALEGIYDKLQPWAKYENLAALTEDKQFLCTCGSKECRKDGFAHRDNNKYQRYRCVQCGALSRGTQSLFPKDTKKTFRKPA